jgi:hypothetical protein
LHPTHAQRIAPAGRAGADRIAWPSSRRESYDGSLTCRLHHPQQIIDRDRSVGGNIVLPHANPGPMVFYKTVGDPLVTGFLSRIVIKKNPQNCVVLFVARHQPPRSDIHSWTPVVFCGKPVALKYVGAARRSYQLAFFGFGWL